jgi:hypothetical protein
MTFTNRAVVKGLERPMQTSTWMGRVAFAMALLRYTCLREVGSC